MPKIEIRWGVHRGDFRGFSPFYICLYYHNRSLISYKVFMKYGVRLSAKHDFSSFKHCSMLKMFHFLVLLEFLKSFNLHRFCKLSR